VGNSIGALDLIRTVEVKFSDVTEVRSAVETMVVAKGDEVRSLKKLKELLERQRANYLEEDMGYVKDVCE